MQFIYYFKMYVIGGLEVFVVYLFFVSEINGQSICSANSNQKWRTKQNTCVDCQPCPPGTARNLTEPYVGPTTVRGDTRCLLCRECPSGFFAGEDGCQPCRKLCDTDYFREYEELCEGSHDAKCGSCLFGYDDTLRNIDFPCSPPIVRELSTEQYKLTDDNNSTNRAAAIALKVHGPAMENNDTYNNIYIIVSASAAGIVICLGVLFAFYIYCNKRVECNGNKTYVLASQEDRHSDSGGELNYIEIDGTSSVSSQDEARGELTDAVPEPPRGPHPELSTPASVMAQLIEYLSSAFSSVGRSHTQSCQCLDDPKCQCYVVYCENIQIQQGDEYIRLVATNICHNERRLYEELNLSDAEIHTKEDDRKVSPYDITLNDKVLMLLNRWVQIGPAEKVTIHQLMKALCKAKFHKINLKIVTKLQDDGVQFYENDNGGSL